MIEARKTCRQVKRSSVTSNIFVTYSENIIIFIIWLFDTRGDFFVQEYIPEFKAINHEDLLDFNNAKRVIMRPTEER